MTEWREPCEGFEYLTDSVSVSAGDQADKLTACGLDPARFDGLADPSFFIGMAIHAGIRSGISAEGNVNMLQSLVQHRPVRLDEPLTVKGRITAVTPVPRGRTIDTDAWFEDASGHRVISARRRSLKPDPTRGGASPRAGAGDRPPPVVADPMALAAAGSHTLTPEGVKAYSSEGNSIHYEMAAANAAGFRAPIIGGGQGVHFLMAELWRDGPPAELDLDIYFRRPIFWDDTFTVGHGDGAICLYRDADGIRKVLTEARINRCNKEPT